ncbi:hypothetical protein U14_01833 [Candidatus Moduliflexus flocculans]|uniref:Uncharacterized protein n=1 Tax=Candidatus Moduliflexus flocculans TaxID=1499966 RepID=A0A0S6VSX3_9BACT|nr:hypothetical protein U14_01833 [Candidatus Moduliflexus flocculans]
MRKSAATSLSPELQQTLTALAHAAEWINRYTTPYIDQKELEKGDKSTMNAARKLKEHINLTDAAYPNGHTVNAEILMYHKMLDQACALAVGDAENGQLVAAQVRERLFQDVIMPYDRLLGRMKKHDSVLGYGEIALKQLQAWLGTQQFSPAQQESVSAVFKELVRIIDNNRALAKKAWGGEELAWLPLQYGLHPDQYDTRDEMNRLIEFVAEKPFQSANKIYYVINEQFQAEAAKMIRIAKDYHVLWIHDYRGVNAANKPDSVSYRQTVRIYFQALLDAVKNYDTTGKIPTYLIIIDQYFYELTDGYFWLDFLQNPLESHLRLPREYQDWVQEFDNMQQQLRQAVAASKRLQEDAKTHGKNWIRQIVKVHVNVTNRADSSFRSSGVFAGIPFVPDDLMRDHRKISFYDVTESDPGKGAALYSGMGIGEQYVGPTWDDRAMLVQGPELLSLKNEARHVLEQQGFRPEQIPEVLREQTKPADYEQKLDALRQQGWNATLLDAHNRTGYARKQLNAVKATLYTLIPSGSTIIVPDGFWNAPLFSSFLVGAALRGCQTLIIAPSPENSTFTGADQLQSRTQELLARLIVMLRELQAEFAAVGGRIRVGLYNRNANLGDPKVYSEFTQTLQANPFLKEVFPFPDEVYAMLDNLAKEVEHSDYKPEYYAKDAEKRKPKLHMKINFFLSDDAKILMNQPGWEELFRTYLQYREKFLINKGHYTDVKDVPENLREAANDLAQHFVSSLTDAQKQQAMAYLTIGSQNHNYRSLIMDGEVGLVVANRASLQVLLDMFFLSGITTWIDDMETLNKYLPTYSGIKRSISRYIMRAL